MALLYMVNMAHMPSLVVVFSIASFPPYFKIKSGWVYTPIARRRKPRTPVAAEKKSEPNRLGFVGVSLESVRRAGEFMIKE